MRAQHFHLDTSQQSDGIGIAGSSGGLPVRHRAVDIAGEQELAGELAPPEIGCGNAALAADSIRNVDAAFDHVGSVREAYERRQCIRWCERARRSPRAPA